jgi:D-amino-acid dehydrogenase
MTEHPVIVIGGGIAGLCTAYSLRRRGVPVSVLDSHRLAGGASSANAGWLCPGQAGPLPEPGLTAYGLRSLLEPDSALYFAPNYLPRMLGWLIGFAAHCNARDHRRGVRALAGLSGHTFELAERFANDGVKCDIYRRGLLATSERRDTAARFLLGLAPLREVGLHVPDRVLEQSELRELEPAFTDRAKFGLLIEDHWHIHPPSFVAALIDRLRQMGVRLYENTPVTALTVRGSTVEDVLTGDGASHRAGAVVVCAGAWSANAARSGGVRLPVRGGKGYSFEIDALSLPQHALLLLDPHFGCSPLWPGRLRIAGTMEFSGLRSPPDQRRIDTIIRAAESWISGVAPIQPLELASGLRPIAPDGLPIIDRAPGRRNLYIATAYSMLGMTLGAPAGEALAEFITTGERPRELLPFRASRFLSVRASALAARRREAGGADRT